MVIDEVQRAGGVHRGAGDRVEAARERLGTLQEVAGALAENRPQPKVTSGRSRRRKRRKRRKSQGQQQQAQQPKAEKPAAVPQPEAKPAETPAA